MLRLEARITELEAENSRLARSRNKWGRKYNETLASLRLAVMTDADCVRAVEEKYDDALKYAQALASFLVKKHFPDNTRWAPLPDLFGVLTQIDNMTTAWESPRKALECTEDAAQVA